MNRIRRLTVKGFKSIREMDLELGPINVLIGANGAGKSNLVSLFGMLNAMMTGRLQEWVGSSGGGRGLQHYGGKETGVEIGLDLQCGPDNVSYHVALCAVAPDKLRVLTEKLRSGSWPPGSWFTNNDGSFLEHLAAEHNPDARFVLDVLRQCRVFQFHDTSASSRIRTTSYVRNKKLSQKPSSQRRNAESGGRHAASEIVSNGYLMSDGGNLAAFLYMLRETQPAYYRRIVGAIRDVAPHFGDFDLEPEKLNPESILLKWREAGEEYPFKPHQLPDGLLRFMALATLLLQPDDSLPQIIVIDEPELGLHPYAINVLGALVRKAAVRCQVVLATQSVNLVDQFDPSEIIVVERHGGPSVFHRLQPEELTEWLERYTLSELWEKNVIGGRPSR